MPSPLGSQVATGQILQTGLNVGNYTVTFDPPTIGIQIPTFECYHIVIDGPAGSAFQIYIDNQFYDNVLHGDVNSWDPHQPMKLNYGNTVYFYWNTGTGGAPTVTMYFQESGAL